MKMSKIVEEVTSANAEYVENFGDKGNLPMPLGRQFAILTCMDARLDPAKYAGLAEGDAHVIRNAGGRASDDAIRSLVISYKLLARTFHKYARAKFNSVFTVLISSILLIPGTIIKRTTNGQY
jgi:hypothetical protein